MNCIICFFWIIIFAEPTIADHDASWAYLETATVPETIEQPTENVTSLASQNDYSHFTKEFLECPKITLYPREYVLENTSSIYIPAYENFGNNKFLTWGNYFIVNINESNESVSVVYICAPDFTVPVEAEREVQKKGPLSYITFICLPVSLLCLALHFIAFLIAPEMRNLPGKNLASLTFSMFMGYSLYLFGLMFDKTETCHVLGIFIYYFMLLSFFWMNTISYDIFKSVRSATTKLRVTPKSAEFKLFVFYSIYSWLTPALIVAVAVIAEETTYFPYNLRPLFRNNRCWFTQRLAIIAFFASPAVVLMLANVIFFVASCVIISSNSMKANKKKGSLKKSVLMYLKLIVITGLMWTIEIVSELINEKILLYIAIALSTLQGLYIFIAFTRFRQVVNRLRGGRKNRESTVHNPSVWNSTFSRMTTLKQIQ